MPQRDVLIRNASPDAYLVAEATSSRTLAGPFISLVDAITTARLLAHGGSIWRENVDDRGRPLGEAIRLGGGDA